MIFLVPQKGRILDSIKTFFSTHILHKFPETDYVFDVYLRSSDWKCFLVDFGVWEDFTESLLFDWEELKDVAVQWEGTDLRIVENQANIRPTLSMTNRLPADLVNLSNAEMITEFCRQMQAGDLRDQ